MENKTTVQSETTKIERLSIVCSSWYTLRAYMVLNTGVDMAILRRISGKLLIGMAKPLENRDIPITETPSMFARLLSGEMEETRKPTDV